MSEAIFLVKLAQILEVSKEDMTEQFKLDYGNWDSLTLVATIAAIDEQFGVTVPIRQLTACASVRDLLELIRGRLAQS